MSEVFSSRRLSLLIRNDALESVRTAFIVSAVFAGMILINGALLAPDIAVLRENFYRGWFSAMLFVWGLIATSRGFRDLHDKTRNEAFLLLPASTLEKVTARLLGLTIGLVLYLLVLTCLVSLAVEMLNALFSQRRNALFNPFDPAAWEMVVAYLVIQPYYFLGAAWFRKSHFIKTSLAILAALLTLTGVVLASIRLFLGAHWWENIGSAGETLYLLYERLFDTTVIGAQLIVFVALPAVCWYTAFLRVRETQVSDGV